MQMWRDWIDEYRRHPVPAGILALTGFAAVVVFVVVFTIRHTHSAPAPDRAPVSKSVKHPAPTVTVIERHTVTAPTRTVVETPRRQVTSTPVRKKRTHTATPSPPPTSWSPTPTWSPAPWSPSPTEEVTPTEDPTPTESPTLVTESP